MSTESTPDEPTYRAVPHSEPSATQFYMVVCDEGWRESILCTSMYDWAAAWLVDQLQGKPQPSTDYVKETTR